MVMMMVRPLRKQHRKATAVMMTATPPVHTARLIVRGMRRIADTTCRRMIVHHVGPISIDRRRVDDAATCDWDSADFNSYMSGGFTVDSYAFHAMGDNAAAEIGLLNHAHAFMFPEAKFIEPEPVAGLEIDAADLDFHAKRARAQ